MHVVDRKRCIALAEEIGRLPLGPRPSPIVDNLSYLPKGKEYLEEHQVAYGMDIIPKRSV